MNYDSLFAILDYSFSISIGCYDLVGLALANVDK